jgi:23S rRNA (guanosine2251-2'-O)-methyltransferase
MQNKDMLFGRRPIIEAIKAEKTFDKLFVQKNLSGELATELLKTAKEYKVVVTKVPPEKLGRLTRKNHQGVVGFISPIEFGNIDQIIDSCYSQGKDPLILMLDRITDVRNFGAIVRTAEASGIDAIIVPSRGAAQISGDAMKTSAGALSLVPICRTNNSVALLRSIKNMGLQLIACTEKTIDTIYEASYSGPTVIIVGSEESGIDQDILAIADTRAKIPMFGKIDSLNVSTSAGIILYEAIRQRTDKSSK